MGGAKKRMRALLSEENKLTKFRRCTKPGTLLLKPGRLGQIWMWFLHYKFYTLNTIGNKICFCLKIERSDHDNFWVLIIELYYQYTGHGNSFGAWLMDTGAKPKLCPVSATKSWDLRNYGFVRISLGFVCSGEQDLWGAARIMSRRQKYFYPTLCRDVQHQFVNQMSAIENPKSDF